MHPHRKLLSVLVACAIPLGTVVGLALSSPAGAAVAHAAAKGTVSCSGTTGNITFNPPLIGQGTPKPEKKVAVTASFGSCTSGGNPVSIKKSVIKIKLAHGSTNACTSFATGTSGDTIKLTVSYATKGVSSSNISFPAGSVSASTGGGNVGFTASGGTAKGSYAGTASFSVQLASSSANNIEACIGGSGSVSSLQIGGGSASY
jgi:hypothetical protein